MAPVLNKVDGTSYEILIFGATSEGNKNQRKYMT